MVAVGLPGSGKSTWFAARGIAPLSSDLMRLLLADDATDQTIHKQVFAALRYLLLQRLALGRPASFIDATNLTVEDRRPWIDIARANGCAAEAVYFDTPLAVCKARNALRSRVVPEDAMNAMAAKLVPPSLAEGFTRIECVALPPETSPAA